MSQIERVTNPAFRLGSGADALELVSLSYHMETQLFLLEGNALPPAFFDLSSGVAGEVLQKLTNYGLRVAVVCPEEAEWSQPFRQFAAESRRGRTFALFAGEVEAREWLAK